MSTTSADGIIQHWNRSFRKWSENYIKPYKTAIIENCLFENAELQKGHSSALKDIEKNKGNICQFVHDQTDQKYFNLLPTKILSDTYSFINRHEYKMVYRSILSNYICWKPGTSNALSKAPLEIQYGHHEHFKCKFRKYQLESMKKFIQATPGTKEIRGQWSVNLANDSMLVSFGNNQEIIIVLKIGSCPHKLNVMYQENGILRKNSKIRKQTLKTSCWGLEKTKNHSHFENSIIIQENYAININADNVLSISPIMVYVKKNRMNQLQYPCLKIFCGDVCNIINLNKRPFHIENIEIPSLPPQQEQYLRLKYRNNLLNHSKSKGGAVTTTSSSSKSSPTRKKKVSKPKPKYYPKSKSKLENNTTSEDDEDDDVWHPVKPKKNHNTMHVDDNGDGNNNDDDGFYPVKPNHNQYKPLRPIRPNNKRITAESVSVTSHEDTTSAIAHSVQDPIANRHNVPSTMPNITSTPSGIYAPQQPPQPPSSVVAHSMNHNDNNSLYLPNHTNTTNGNTTTFGDDSSLIAPQFDSNSLIDDGLNWSMFTDNGLNQTNMGLSRFPSLGTDFPNTFDPFTPMGPMPDDPLTNINLTDNNMNHNTNGYLGNPDFMDTTTTTPQFNDNPMHPPMMSMDHDANNNNPIPLPQPHHPHRPQMNAQEMHELRRQNDLLLRRVADQQRQIEFLARQIGTMHHQFPLYDDNNNNGGNNYMQTRSRLKRRRISSEALLPPAA